MSATPGPWLLHWPIKYKGKFYSAGATINIYSESEEEWSVAQIFTASPSADANARLIAAAPDMLDALKALCEIADSQIDALKEDLALPYGDAGFRKWASKKIDKWEMALAAIAKATGSDLGSPVEVQTQSQGGIVP